MPSPIDWIRKLKRVSVQQPKPVHLLHETQGVISMTSAMPLPIVNTAVPQQPPSPEPPVAPPQTAHESFLQRLEGIFTIIETASVGAAEALSPTNPSLATDLGLGGALLAIIGQLLPHVRTATNMAIATAPAAKQ